MRLEEAEDCFCRLVSTSDYFSALGAAARQSYFCAVLCLVNREKRGGGAALLLAAARSVGV